MYACCLIFINISFAQEKETTKEYTYPDAYFTFDPVNTFSPVPLPRFNVGYFMPVSKSDRWRVGTSVGYGTEKVSIYGRTGEDYRLWEIRPQLIYHLKRGTRVKAFFSLELFYINHTETRIDSRFRPENDFPILGIGPNLDENTVGFDQADYQRIKYGFTINYGDYIRFSDRIGLRSSAGIGMRIKNNTYTNIVNPQSDSFDSFVTPYYQNEGISVGAEVHISFRLYFITRKKSKS
jgi:hypothetical protein